jgi:hypothetical protein
MEIAKQTKRPTSSYLEEKYCEQLRELLRDAMQRHEEGKPLPKFHANHYEYEQKMFDVIDKALMSFCDDCPDRSDGGDGRGSRTEWEDLD